jgi:hypothetical protein
MDQITNPPSPRIAPEASPPEDVEPSPALRAVVLGLFGFLLVGIGSVWLLRYGYHGVWLALLLSVPASLGVAALTGTWTVLSGRNWRWAGAAGLVALLLLGFAGKGLLSPWYQRAAERRAWQRYQESSAPVLDRWRAYNASVPEPFRRPQPEIDYQLDRIREYAGVRHMLSQLLRDLDARHGGDPNFDPVRQQAREALDALPPET